MRTREDQIEDLTDDFDMFHARNPGGGMRGYERHASAQEIAAKHILEAERRAEQRVRAEIAKRHTWFYMVDDPESGHADLADMLCETKPFEIVETSEAADIRIFYAYQDEDGEIYEFPTQNEAERSATKSIDAAREAQG